MLNISILNIVNWILRDQILCFIIKMIYFSCVVVHLRRGPGRSTTGCSWWCSPSAGPARCPAQMSVRPHLASLGTCPAGCWGARSELRLSQTRQKKKKEKSISSLTEQWTPVEEEAARATASDSSELFLLNFLNSTVEGATHKFFINVRFEVIKKTSRVTHFSEGGASHYPAPFNYIFINTIEIWWQRPTLWILGWSPAQF